MVLINRQVVFICGGVLVAVVVSIIVMSPLLQSESSDSVKASYKYLNTKKKKDSGADLFPEELTAVIKRESDHWAADGPITPLQISDLVKKAKVIRSIRFRSSEINAESLKLLTGVGLNELRLNNNSLAVEEMKVISKIKGLKRLYLEDNELKDYQLAHFNGPTSLEVLIYKRNHVNQSFITKIIEKFTKLTMLDVSRTNVRYKDLLIFKKLKRKLMLVIIDCPNLSKAEIEKLKKLNSKLTVLDTPIIY